MMSLSEEKQSELIEAFSSTSRYFDDLLATNQRVVGCFMVVFCSIQKLLY